MVDSPHSHTGLGPTQAPAATPVARARTLDPVNWLGLWTLYTKEIRRFLKVSVQTVLAPAVQTLLFIAVLSLAWGQDRADVLGQPFATFIAPGLVMMSILTNAFANSSSSLIVSKIQGSSVDFLMPPLSSGELAAAFVAGAATRGLLVGAASLLVVAPFADITPAHPLWAIYFAVVGAVLLGAIGAVAGVWAEKFDHLSAVTSFVITPLTFLSGTFYSVTILPDAIEPLVRANPVFHLIDGFRYGFIGTSDGSVAVAAVSTGVLALAMVALVYVVFRSGWRLKA